jgi:hypothetical protein
MPGKLRASFPWTALLYLEQELQRSAHLRVSLESLPLKIRSFPNQLFCGLVLAAASLVMGACRAPLYYHPEYNYAGRPTPPSGLLNRVMATYTANGTSGGAEILDALNDLRRNIQNTIPSYFIGGFSAADPISIISFPEQTTGYVLSATDGTLYRINYSSESSNGTVASFGTNPASAAAAPSGEYFAAANETNGQVLLVSGATTYAFSLPNVYKVATNQGATVILAMVHNSNSLYRIVQLPSVSNPVLPPGYVDCQPLLLPSFCLVPVADKNSAGVAGAAYDHPSGASFSLDGTTAYIDNCGPECGGTTAGVTMLQEGALILTNVPTVDPLCGDAGHPTCPAGTPSTLTSLPVANPIAVPGGVTATLSDGATLYLAGQQLQGSGLFAGNLSLLSLTTYAITNTYSISDGLHTKLIFGDDNTLWIGSTQCSNGARAALAAAKNTTQAANYNCLTRFVTNSTAAGGSNAILPVWSANTAYTAGQTVTDGANVEVVLTAGTSGGSKPTWTTNTNGYTSTTDGGVTWVNVGAVTPVQITPIVTPNNPTASQANGGTNIAVQYPNTDQNQYYYGTLSGICWVQNLHKMYSAYGGQIHAFYTVDGSEINNINITIQGTVFDVAYMDALTNSAN